MTVEPTSVLDASALLAQIQNEPGAARVGEAIAQRAVISAVNWAEVLTRLAEAGEDPDDARQRLETAGLIGNLLKIAPLTADDAVAIARLRPPTRAYGLSLGDRACLALGLRLRLPVWTADRDWARLRVGVPINLIR